jgi:hypothetical protein
MKPLYFVIGVTVFFLAMSTSAFRWQLILRATGTQAGIWPLTIINFVGNFFSMFLPTAVGGDIARMYELSRQSNTDNVQVVSTVMLDRLIGLVSLAIMALIASVASYRYIAEPTIIIVVSSLSIGLLFGWRLFFDRRFVNWFRCIFDFPVISYSKETVRNLYHSLFELQQHPGLLVSTLAVSFLLQFVEILSAIFISHALNINVSAVYFFIFMPLIWLVTLAPFSLNGLGVREGAFTFFFGLVGVSPSEAVALSLLVYACRLLTGLVGGVMFLRSSLAKYSNGRTWAEVRAR